MVHRLSAILPGKNKQQNNMKTRGLRYNYKEINDIDIPTSRKRNAEQIFETQNLPGTYDVERIVTKRCKSVSFVAG